MKIAIVHDHLVQDGGAERVAKELLEIFPKGDFFTLLHNKNHFNNFSKQPIKTSFLQNIPLLNKKHEWLLPLMPSATEHHDLSKYQLIISSSSIFSKGVITRPGALHICYCHTPPRFLWTDTHQYLQEIQHNALVKKILPLTLTKLRLWDRLASERVDHFLANSLEVQKRIKKYYNRESQVIYPPVDTSKFHITGKVDNYFLAGGRFVGYKRFDLIIQAFNRLNLPLKIFGAGPLEKKLQKMARNNIQFLGKIKDKEKIELLSRARAFINPQQEDFGITAVESMSAGRPVIAYKKGGALETIIDRETGNFFDEQTWESLAYAVLRFKETDFRPEIIKNHAQKFDRQIFEEKIKNFVLQKIEQRKNELSL